MNLIGLASLINVTYLTSIFYCFLTTTLLMYIVCSTNVYLLCLASVEEVQIL